MVKRLLPMSQRGQLPSRKLLKRLYAVAAALNFLKPRDRGLWKGDANALVRFRDTQYV